MSYQKSLKLIIAVILVLSFLVGCGGSTPTTISEAPAATLTPVPPTATPELPAKILFVGNSLTYSNGGLDVHLERLAGSADPSLVIVADSAVRPSSGLEIIWEYTNAREVIGEGDYDVVVLQDYLVNTRVDNFHDSVRKFNADIKEAGAETVLFMEWPPYERLGSITMEEIAQANNDIAAELSVDVAPIGLAFQRAMEERPELDVYHSDKLHPNILGTFLATNVVYATLFEKNPIGLAYLPSEYPGVTEEEAAFLQRIAWETVQEYQAQ